MLTELNIRYRNLTDEELIKQIMEDFGEEASNKLKEDGFLMLNEAIKLRNKAYEDI